MTHDDDYNVVKNQINEGDLKNKMPKHALDTVKSSIEDENVFRFICGEKETPSSQTHLINASLDHSVTRRLVKVTGFLCMVIVGSHMCLNHTLSGNI
jgi:hypothetical protein